MWGMAESWRMPAKSSLYAEDMPSELLSQLASACASSTAGADTAHQTKACCLTHGSGHTPGKDWPATKLAEACQSSTTEAKCVVVGNNFYVVATAVICPADMRRMFHGPEVL
jgi:hypothetical protein